MLLFTIIIIIMIIIIMIIIIIIVINISATIGYNENKYIIAILALIAVQTLI